MAYEAKTKVEDISVAAFIHTIAAPDRQAEALRLVEMFEEVTGYRPHLYSGGMVGFGRYAYTYESGHSGTSLAVGFAPRKGEISLYNVMGPDSAEQLARLGKHKAGKGCLYLKRLSDADEAVLREMIASGLADLKTRWVVEAT